MKLLLLLLALYLFCSPVYCETFQIKPSLAFVKIKGKPHLKPVTDKLEGLIWENLDKLTKYEIIDRENTDQIVFDYNFKHFADCQNLDCLVNLGKFLGTEFLLTGRIEENLYTYNFSFLLINNSKKEVVVAVNEEFKKNQEDLNLFVKKVMGKVFSEKPWADYSYNVQSSSDTYIYSAVEKEKDFYSSRKFWTRLLIAQFFTVTVTYMLLK